MRSKAQHPIQQSRKAVILLAVLVVVVLLTLAAYQYVELVTAEYRAADSYTRSGQAKAYAASGVHYVASIVGNSTNFTNVLNGNPYDNPGAFQGIVVAPSDQPNRQGRFSIVSPLGPDDTTSTTNPFRYGLTDESGKININALMQPGGPGGQKAHDILINLPNMTEEIVNCILDWIDTNETPRSSGAKSDYYSTLNPPYRCKSGPLDTPEELLLVKGITPPLLLGNDFNRNGILDPGEDDGTGVVNHGWSAYLTVFSRELNLASDGTPRIWINDFSDLNSLYTNLQTPLGQELAKYIILYQMYGEAQGGARPSVSLTGTQSSQALAQATQNSTRRPTQVTSFFDLAKSTAVDVTIPGAPPRTPPTTFRFTNPLRDPGTMRQLLPILFDKTTTTNNPIPARVNVNTAPQAVLTALLTSFPNLTGTDVQNIIDHRPNMSSADAPDPIFQTPTWLITEANLDPKNLSGVDRFITASTGVYRIQSIGYFDGGGPTARIEAVIDTNNQRPRIVSWRDLTELGKGFELGSR
jgi:type II secretory pathway component PulK